MASSDPVVAIVGIKALSRDINRLVEDERGPLLQALKQAGKTAAEPVAAATRSALPHMSGALAGSVRSSGTRTGATVRLGSKRLAYGGWVDFGGTRHRPHVSSREYVKDGRYLFPSARGLASRSEQLYSDALTRIFASSGVWTNPGDNPHD